MSARKRQHDTPQGKMAEIAIGYKPFDVPWVSNLSLSLSLSLSLCLSLSLKMAEIAVCPVGYKPLDVPWKPSNPFQPK
jgi:hypothetical protein